MAGDRRLPDLAEAVQRHLVDFAAAAGFHLVAEEEAAGELDVGEALGGQHRLDLLLRVAGVEQARQLLGGGAVFLLGHLAFAADPLAVLDVAELVERPAVDACPRGTPRW